MDEPGTGRCPDCGAEQTVAERAAGICSRCLIGLGLDASLDGPDSRAPLPEAAEAPAEIGPYRIVEKLGEGGMGVVFRAEQTEPIRRTVALKLIKLGMDTRRVLARFESERRTLALMNHPNIAQVLDAGIDRGGRPYFVMEYVSGIPITEHCDRRGLGLEQRLELFAQACDAVQHAHRKGILHRDVKPSNVLVSVDDGRALVKVIDFGIAKAVNPEGGGPAVVTVADTLVGTPEYMSPEQAAGRGDVDTRSDVYSLGVLLYELLCGSLPFDSERLRSAGVEETRRIIREEPVPRPSSCVPDTGRASVTRRSLARELDWITLKAMDKEPERRYGSPDELVADLRRFLAEQPVLAGPPTAGYRLKKFAGRHRFGVGVSTVAAITLVAVMVALATQARRIARERDRANEEAKAATFVSDFLIDLFEVSDPGEARGNSIQAREILDRGASKIAAESDESPEVRARLMATMGAVYKKLGLYADAEPLLEQARALRAGVLGPGHPETLRTALEIAELRFFQGDLARAESELRDTLDRARASLGPEHPDTMAALGDLGVVMHFQGKLADAEALYLETLELRERVLGADDEDTLETVNNLAALFYSQGQFDKAEPFMRRALEGRRRVLGSDHPEALDSLMNLAVVLQTQGKLDEAERYSREAVEIGRRVRPEHPKTWVAINNLGVLLSSQGRLDEAVEQYRQAIALLSEAVGEDHPDTLTALGNLGDLYTTQGRYDEALPLLEKALDGVRRTLPHEHLANAYTLRKYGRYLLLTGQLAQAEPILLEAYRLSVATAGNDHKHTTSTVELLARLYAELGRTEEAANWRARLP